jgi:hypothetical protein
MFLIYIVFYYDTVISNKHMKGIITAGIGLYSFIFFLFLVLGRILYLIYE